MPSSEDDMAIEEHNNAHALDVLKRYNAWRRDRTGERTMDDYGLTPREIGHAVDVAIAVLAERMDDEERTA